MSKMVLGIPNGNPFCLTMELFERVGLTADTNGRNFMVGLDGLEMFSHGLLMRSHDIPEAIMDGVIDCGICGWDCVVESGLER